MRPQRYKIDYKQLKTDVKNKLIRETKTVDQIKFVSSLSKNKDIWNKTNPDLDEIQMDIIRKLSNRGFLISCDLTGLTMLSWSMAQIFQKKRPADIKEFQKHFENFMRNLENQYLYKM